MIFLAFVVWTAVIVQQYGKQNILKCIICQMKCENIKSMTTAEAAVIICTNLKDEPFVNKRSENVGPSTMKKIYHNIVQ